MNKKEYTPVAATHPGELIRDELKERGMTQKQLAADMDIKPSVLSETVNGKRAISMNMALALEKALEIPAEIWLNKVEHGVRVMADEEGVKAAAYTAELLCGSAMPPDEKMDFVLDRPFMFVIRSAEGIPLFVGIVERP